jgi:catechol 2,3-dioxygenase-like lactoylglutathione lyase family enzyme
MLHHVELYVSSLATSARWWGMLLTRLGWTPYQAWDSGCSWRSSDGTYLVLVQVADDARTPPYHRRRVGLNHLAFRAGSRAQVDRLAMDLISGGTRLLYADRYPWAGGRGHYAAYVTDPDGIKVELVADRM